MCLQDSSHFVVDSSTHLNCKLGRAFPVRFGLKFVKIQIFFATTDTIVAGYC